MAHCLKFAWRCGSKHFPRQKSAIETTTSKQAKSEGIVSQSSNWSAVAEKLELWNFDGEVVRFAVWLVQAGKSLPEALQKFHQDPCWVALFFSAEFQSLHNFAAKSKEVKASQAHLCDNPHVVLADFLLENVRSTIVLHGCTW